MMVDMDPITKEEVPLIEELRSAVSDLDLKDSFDKDEYYVRWLRARELNIDHAEEMLRKSMEWRKENDIDDITTAWEPKCATVPVDFPLDISSRNKLGSPVAILPFSYWDLRKGVEAGQADEMIRYIDQALESVEDFIVESASSDKPAFQADFIFDMNGLSFWQLTSMKTIEMLLEIVRRYESNHPELLHTAYVINASRIFHMLFNIIKPFLAPRTLSKVKIFSGQPSEWMAALRENFDKDQLPIYFGGIAHTRLKMYQDKEKSSKYFSGVSPVISPDNLTTININPEEQVLLTFEVEEANSILKWEFKTDYYDIEFGMYREGSKENETLIQRKRVTSHFRKIMGGVTCTVPGLYVAEFNNKYSDIRRAKTLRYRFHIVPPS